MPPAPGFGPRCGDGDVQAGIETCDDGDANSLNYNVSATCTPTCDGYGPHCGDGTIQGAEICDNGGDNSNPTASSRAAI